MCSNVLSDLQNLHRSTVLLKHLTDLFLKYDTAIYFYGSLISRMKTSQILVFALETHPQTHLPLLPFIPTLLWLGISQTFVPWNMNTPEKVSLCSMGKVMFGNHCAPGRLKYAFSY